MAWQVEIHRHYNHCETSLEFHDEEAPCTLYEDDLTLKDIPTDAFVVYQGHHGDRSAY
jgi:hypothetical protein